MINPAELRIGNLVTWNPQLINPTGTLSPMTVKVSAIMQNQVGYTPSNFENRVEPFEDDKLQLDLHYKPLNQMAPIPLTLEILESAGFKKKFGSALKIKGDDFYYDIKKKSAYYIKEKFLFNEVLHVHQLQNLYNTLTGKELNIDLIPAS